MLVVAASARIFVQSAQRLGLKAAAVDLFDDQDTRAASVASCVASRAGRPLELDPDQVVAGVRRFAETYKPACVIVGGGLEEHPGLLARLQQVAPLAGNSVEVFDWLGDRVELHAWLRDLGVSTPEVAGGGMVPRHGRWLLKPLRGSGGRGIRFAAPGCPVPRSHFCQQWLSGRTYSACFLADEHGVGRLLGMSAHWRVVGNAPDRFTMSGLVSIPDVAAPVLVRLRDTVRRIGETRQLRGVNGFDFTLADDGEVRVLDLNLRPPRGVEVLPRDVDWLALHLGWHQPGIVGSPSRIATASAVIYSRRAGEVPAGVAFPPWMADLPSPGMPIASGQPLFSIHSTGKTPAAACREAVSSLRQWCTGSADASPLYPVLFNHDPEPTRCPSVRNK